MDREKMDRGLPQEILKEFDWYEDDHFLILECKQCGEQIVFAVSAEHPTREEVIATCQAHLVHECY